MQHLFQHENSHKFSTDALLLTEFVIRSVDFDKVNYIADLGTGCGVIALEILQKNKNIKGIGVDFSPELLATAEQNAELYDLRSCIVFVEEDFQNFPQTTQQETKNFKHKCELVVSNPPWLLSSQGKVPTSSMKKNALFGNKEKVKA